MPTEERQLFKQKLRSGVHVGADYTKAAVKTPVLDPLSRERVGDRDVYPEVTVRRGETYYSDVDLAAADPARWEAAGERRERSRVTVPVQIAAPQGQVSDGFQQSFANPSPDAGSASGVADDGSRLTGPRGENLTVGQALGKEAGYTGPDPKAGKAKAGAKVGDKAGGEDDDADQLEQLTKAELQEEAERRGVKVSAHMSKAEMVEAVKAGPQDDDEGD